MESIENYRRFLDNQSGHVIQDSRTGEWNVESEGVDPALVSECVCVWRVRGWSVRAALVSECVCVWRVRGGPCLGE